MAKALLRNLVNIDGDSQIEIVLGDEVYQSVKAAVQEKVEKPFRTYLNELNMKEQFAKLNTVEELETVKVRPFNLEMRQLLASTIDELDIKPHQKVWVFSHFVYSFSQGAMAIIQNELGARYQQILDKDRIIKPKSKIITSI